jgi:hypothetical protein
MLKIVTHISGFKKLESTYKDKSIPYFDQCRAMSEEAYRARVLMDLEFVIKACECYSIKENNAK